MLEHHHTNFLFVGLAMIESLAIYCLAILMILIFATRSEPRHCPVPWKTEACSLIVFSLVVAQAINFSSWYGC